MLEDVSKQRGGIIAVIIVFVLIASTISLFLIGMLDMQEAKTDEFDIETCEVFDINH